MKYELCTTGYAYITFLFLVRTSRYFYLIRIQRIGQKLSIIIYICFTFQLPDLGECVLARPEFNSTLYISKDLQKLKDSKLDISEALQEKLKVTKTREKIAEKVCFKVHEVITLFYIYSRL